MPLCWLICINVIVPVTIKQGRERWSSMSPRSHASGPWERWIERLLRHSQLSADCIAAIRRFHLSERELPSGRDVVQLGTVTAEACLVVEGMVGRFHQDVEGRRQITSIFLPGDMADLHSVTLPLASASLVTVGRTRIAKVPHAAFRDLTRRFPDLAEACWRDDSLDAERASRWTFVLGRLNAAGRVAHLLCELGLRMEVLGFDRIRYPFPPSQAQIGEMLGLTAVHVNRTMRFLRERQIADVKDRCVIITNWPALAQTAQFDETYLHRAREPRI